MHPSSSDSEKGGNGAPAFRGAVILGSNVNGIGVIRSLGRLGVTCGAIFPPQDGDHAYHSKYLRVAERAAADADDHELREVLARAAGLLRAPRPVLIPTSDRYSQFLCTNQASLAEEYIFNCADIDLYDTFLDKWKTYGICNENNVLVPRTVCPQATDQLPAIARDLRYPVIVKPRYTFGDAFPGKNAQCENITALLAFFERHDVIGDAIIQEIIPSGDGDVLVLASYSDNDGKVRAMYSGRKIRQYLPDYGSTSFGISEKHPELEQRTREFLDKIGYRGFAMVEFARSRDDGRPYFLELNTRTAWTNRLFADAGVDLTQIGYLDMIGMDYEAVVGPIEQRDGINWLEFRRDFGSMRIKRKHQEITILQWLRSIVRARSFAYWSWRDPIPFVVACFWRFGKWCRNYLMFGSNDHTRTQ